MAIITKQAIQAIFQQYDNEKEWWRKLFGSDHLAISAARTLLSEITTDGLGERQLHNLLKCFVDNYEGQDASWRAILSILDKIDNGTASPTISGLKILKSADMLTQGSMSAVITYDLSRSRSIADALSILNSSADMLTRENVAAVIAHANPRGIADALSALNRTNMLTRENRNAVIAHADPLGIAHTLSTLNSANMLTQKNRNAVIAAYGNHPSAIHNAFYILNSVDIPLTRENVAAVIAHARPWTIVHVLATLNGANILTEANFNSLLTQGDQWLLTETARQIVWSRIGTFLLMHRGVFDQISTRAGQANPAIQVGEYVNQLLGITPEAVPRCSVNNAQSTHTASVHQAVSASATKLFNKYSSKIAGKGLKETIEALQGWADTLPSSTSPQDKDAAAARCIARLTARNYTFTDLASEVSTQQLLALAFFAIHDDNQRVSGCSKEDAKKRFVQGLYEIQRGYNLSESGVDNNLQDNPICLGGTFNKLIEALAGVHPDCEICFITKKTAAHKLPIVVREEVLCYLSQLKNSDSRKELISQVQLKGVEAIWYTIQTVVSEKMFEEFGSVYPKEHGKYSRAFTDFIASARDMMLEGKLVVNPTTGKVSLAPATPLPPSSSSACSSSSSTGAFFTPLSPSVPSNGSSAASPSDVRPPGSAPK